MRRLFISIASACLIFCCAPAGAQSTAEVVATCGSPPATRAVGSVRTLTQDPSGRLCDATAIVSGGDATAANQTLQITQETAFNTALGLMADAACATDNGTCALLALVKRGNQRLTTLNTTLGTPFQAGGSIANTTFGATQATAANLNATVVGAGTAGTANAGVVTVQGIASMTKLLVTPDSVALPANQSVNVAQINGITPLMGNGVTGTGSPRVTIASDNTAFSVNAAQSGTWTVQPGNTPNTSAWLTTNTLSSAAGAATTSASSTAAASNLVLKASAGNLYSLTITIGATSGYVMLFDATALPSNGAVTPVWCYPVTSNGTNGGVAIEFANPKRFGTGITAGFSTTGCFTLTASATGNFFGGYQ